MYIWEKLISCTIKRVHAFMFSNLNNSFILLDKEKVHLWALHFGINGNYLFISSWFTTKVQVSQNMGVPNISTSEPCWFYFSILNYQYLGWCFIHCKKYWNKWNTLWIFYHIREKNKTLNWKKYWNFRTEMLRIKKEEVSKFFQKNLKASKGNIFWKISNNIFVSSSKWIRSSFIVHSNEQSWACHFLLTH